MNSVIFSLNLFSSNSINLLHGLSFNDCELLDHVTLPYSTGGLYSSVFSDCRRLRYAVIPTSNFSTDMGESVFNACENLKTVIYGEGYNEIPMSTFNYCISLNRFEVPKYVTYIGENAFYYCVNLQSITIPEGVTEVGENAFSDCISLASITFPSSVQVLGRDLFSCDAAGTLKEIRILSTLPPTIDDDETGDRTFDGIPEDCIIYVPESAKQAYANNSKWYAWADYIEGGLPDPEQALA